MGLLDISRFGRVFIFREFFRAHITAVMADGKEGEIALLRKVRICFWLQVFVFARGQT